MLQFCDKLNKANIELERMLVHERNTESEHDFKPTHGHTPHVKRPNFFIDSSETGSKDKHSQSEGWKKNSEQMPDVVVVDSDTEICQVEEFTDSVIESV